MECKGRSGGRETSEEVFSGPDRYSGGFWFIVVSVAFVQGIRLEMQLGVGAVRTVDGLDRGIREKRRACRLWPLHQGE